VVIERRGNQNCLYMFLMLSFSHSVGIYTLLVSKWQLPHPVSRPVVLSFPPRAVRTIEHHHCRHFRPSHRSSLRNQLSKKGIHTPVPRGTSYDDADTPPSPHSKHARNSTSQQPSPLANIVLSSANLLTARRQNFCGNSPRASVVILCSHFWL
jgi:hypothetical protein